MAPSVALLTTTESYATETEEERATQSSEKLVEPSGGSGAVDPFECERRSKASAVGYAVFANTPEVYNGTVLGGDDDQSDHDGTPDVGTHVQTAQGRDTRVIVEEGEDPSAAPVRTDLDGIATSHQAMGALFRQLESLNTWDDGISWPAATAPTGRDRATEGETHGQGSSHTMQRLWELYLFELMVDPERWD
jgi:hypothetical protein